MPSLTINGREYVAVPIEQWTKIPAKWRAQMNPDAPERFRTATGDYDAIPTLRASVARDIIQARLARRWSQRQLAAATGVRQATVVSVESGRKTPNVRTIEKLEAALARGAASRC